MSLWTSKQMEGEEPIQFDYDQVATQTYGSPVCWFLHWRMPA